MFFVDRELFPSNQSSRECQDFEISLTIFFQHAGLRHQHNNNEETDTKSLQHDEE